MRWFLDENLSPVVAEALAHHFRRDEFYPAQRDPGRYGSVLDVDLLAMVAGEGFDGFITFDRRQLRVDAERDAIRTSALHWVGIPHAKGLGGITFTTASLVAGLPYVVDAIETLGCQVAASVHQVTRRPSQRVRLIDLASGDTVRHPREV